jgi:hypothetical protein
LRRPTGYLSIGDLVSDLPLAPSPGPPGGGYFGRGPGMGKGRVFGGPWGNDKECDTFSCKHCCRVVFIKPFCDPADMGGLCRSCHGLICEDCVKLGNCDPYEEKLKRWEASYHARRSYEECSK